jgi:hypothetical protein
MPEIQEKQKSSKPHSLIKIKPLKIEPNNPVVSNR